MLLSVRNWLTRFYQRVMGQWSWWLLIVLAIGIRLLVYFPEWVERYYSNGLYPYIGLCLRVLFGWLPFSFGDLLYAFVFIAILYPFVQGVIKLVKKEMNRSRLAAWLQRLLFLLLLGYVGFNLLWGLNYNRPSLANRLNMKLQVPTSEELDTLATDLIRRLNEYAPKITPSVRDSFNQKSRLFQTAAKAYQDPTIKRPGSSYRQSSIKPSLYSYPGNYLGFQGYYNPFSGEAQVNTTIPRFLEPFVTAHEIAHQLGFAKEQEANFVAVLVCDQMAEPVFRYSMYLDLFLYTVGEISIKDTARARGLIKQLPHQAREDILAYRRFIRQHRNPVETGIMWLYGEFLRANNQPNGKFTYNEVVAWVIAYRRTFGRSSLL